MKLDGFDELNKKLVQISKNQAIQRNRFVAREAENLLSNTKNYTPVAEVDGTRIRKGPDDAGTTSSLCCPSSLW